MRSRAGVEGLGRLAAAALRQQPARAWMCPTEQGRVEWQAFPDRAAPAERGRSAAAPNLLEGALRPGLMPQPRVVVNCWSRQPAQDPQWHSRRSRWPMARWWEVMKAQTCHKRQVPVLPPNLSSRPTLRASGSRQVDASRSIVSSSSATFSRSASSGALSCTDSA